MTKLKCKNTKNYKITLNAEYDIEEEDGNYVKIINDSGKLVRYDRSLFEDVNTVPPPPPPPPIRTQAQIIQSIVISNQNNTVRFRYNDRTNQLVESPGIGFSRHNPDMSCGVETIDGLNNIIATIEATVNTEHDDYINLKKSIFVKVINEVKSICRASNRGAIIFSTNNNTNHEDYYSWLQQVSMSTTDWFLNPNSNNQIKIWCVNTAV